MGEKKKREIPTDFAEHANEPVDRLKARYGTVKQVIDRWKSELTGEANSEPNVGYIDPRAYVCLTCEKPTCPGICDTYRNAEPR